MENNSWLLQWGGNYTLYRRCFKLQSILNLSDRSSVHACSSTKRQGWRQLTECLGEVKFLVGLSIQGNGTDDELETHKCAVSQITSFLAKYLVVWLPQEVYFLILIDLLLLSAIHHQANYQHHKHHNTHTDGDSHQGTCTQWRVIRLSTCSWSY